MSVKPVPGQYVVGNDGRRTAVILPIDDYERLLEDLHDLAVIAERRRERPIGLAELRKRLRTHGRRPR